jgi:hypothetical protein
MDTLRSKRSQLSKKEFSKTIQSQRLAWSITRTRHILTSEMSIVPWESPTSLSSWQLLKVENGITLRLLIRSLVLITLNLQEMNSVVQKEKFNSMASPNQERATNLVFPRSHKNLTPTCLSSSMVVENLDHKVQFKANVISDRKA